MSCAIRDSEPKLSAQGRFAQAEITLCEGCLPGGYTLVEEDGLPVSQTCPGHWAIKRAKLFNKAQLPARFLDASFATFQVQPRGRSLPDLQEAHGESYRWYTGYDPGNPEGKPGLVLSGPPGIGKTHLAVALVRGLTLEKGVPCRFADYRDLVAAIKAGWDQGHGSSALIEDLCQVEVLVIDDLGSGHSSEWNRNLIDTIVSHRYNANRATIATTNFPLARREDDGRSSVRLECLEDRVGPRVSSRLLGGAVQIVIKAPDYRQG